MILRISLFLAGVGLLVASNANLAFGHTRHAVKTRDAPLHFLDLREPKQAGRWTPQHDIAEIERTAQGITLRVAGTDPYIGYAGPPMDFPPDQLLWLEIRLRTDQSGTAQLFYFRHGEHPTEQRSVRFDVPGGEWHSARIPLQALGPATSLRFDPPGRAGVCMLQSIAFRTRILPVLPAWPAPVPGTPPSDRVVSSGRLCVAIGDGPSDFYIQVGERWMAMAHNRPLIGYEVRGTQRWLDLNASGRTRVEEHSSRGSRGFRIETTATDEEGVRWTLSHIILPNHRKDAIDIESRVAVSRDRESNFVPILILLPGAATARDSWNGASKGQGLFCGLEYLQDEPSSSELDIIGQNARRTVPDSLKITIPLMAIQADDRYVGLIWEPNKSLSALFDSPDRVFRSGGHAMGLIFPGSHGLNREGGMVLPYSCETLKASRPLVIRTNLIGGSGKSVVPAIQQYVAIKGLPQVPNAGQRLRHGFDRYATAAARGWLDSAINAGDGTFRHAWPGEFAAQPAADAAVYTDWLSAQVSNHALASRLSREASKAIGKIGTEDYNLSGVSHIRYPVASLLYSRTQESISGIARSAESEITRFESDGSITYIPHSDGLDYGRTHFARHANGLTAASVLKVLRAAAFTGDPALRRQGLRLLRALDRYVDGIPRGAQTWEIPLHTPDILASANLLNCYLLGYKLTGEMAHLEIAKYWAWTGVPFVYLIRPDDGEIGLYATIAVYGATQWTSPDWMGLPVQWCGLVYARALYDLSDLDPEGPWKKIASGITASAVRQTWPVNGNGSGDSKRQGLLPDSFSLRPQIRNDAAINPGTLQSCAPRLFNRADIYGFRSFRSGTILAHAPGPIDDAREDASGIQFTVNAWTKTPYEILLNGLPPGVRVTVNGTSTPLAAPHHWNSESGRLILRLSGRPRIRITDGQP